MLRYGLLLTFTFLLNGCATLISTANPGETIDENQGRRTLGAMVDDSSIETAIKVNRVAVGIA